DIEKIKSDKINQARKVFEPYKKELTLKENFCKILKEYKGESLETAIGTFPLAPFIPFLVFFPDLEISPLGNKVLKPELIEVLKKSGLEDPFSGFTEERLPALKRLGARKELFNNLTDRLVNSGWIKNQLEKETKDGGKLTYGILEKKAEKEGSVFYQKLYILINPENSKGEVPILELLTGVDEASLLKSLYSTGQVKNEITFKESN
ncbi:MAG: hypothetical protein HYU63_06650, partial [Armatimonadetes bacterium]|nr:hypothetical protein [Armatimonadota bacterium]